MIKESIHSYIHYLKTVLGVRYYLEPKNQLTEEEHRAFLDLSKKFVTADQRWPEPSSMDLLVILQSPFSQELWIGESGELWEKMKIAMKLGNYQFLELQAIEVVDDGDILSMVNRYSARAVLFLTAQPRRITSDQIKILAGAKVIETYNPATLVGHPALKKPAWEDLQRVMFLL